MKDNGRFTEPVHTKASQKLAFAKKGETAPQKPQLCDHKLKELAKKEEEFLKRQTFVNTKNVVLCALASRLIILIMQFAFNLLIEDHDPDVFNPPPTQLNNQLDHLVQGFLSGFRRWDSIYLLHVAEYGYSYENTLAFFPGFPLLVRSVGFTLLRPLHLWMNVRSILMISAFLVNLTCFVLATLYLYQFARLLIGKGNRPWFVALLFCFNPASIFMSAAYTESMFALCSFAHMYYIEKSAYGKATVAMALAVSCRSNGLVLVGYPLYKILLTFLSNEPAKRQFSKLISVWMKLSCCILYGLLPFAMFQYMAFDLYCRRRDMTLHRDLKYYGEERGYHVATDPPSPWCSWSVPIAYSYIQSAHWGVGFLKYYTVEQIPNFILASPVVLFSLMAIGHHVKLLGNHLFEVKNIRVWLNTSTGSYLPYVLHLLFLVVYGLGTAHVQILTRMVYSSTPLIYIYLSKYVAQYYTQNKRGRFVKLVLVHFVGYFVLGTFIHSNFLPWT